MDGTRIKAIGKLAILFGLPSALILGLFSCGVYCGAQYRHGITKFERDWLGLDVEVPPAPPDSGSKGEKPAEDDAKSGDKTAEAEDKPKPDPADKDAPEPVAKPADEAPPEPTKPPPQPVPEPVPAVEPTPTKADPLEGALADRHQLPVVVHVKVLVDEELIADQPAWIDYVQRTVSYASQVYLKQFGIELKLASVGRWAVATEGMSAKELLEDVTGRPREGAEIVLGFTARPLDGSTAGRAETPRDDSPFNGAYGVVYSVPQQRMPHLRTTLHEVGHMFGALDVTDADDPAFRAGSWMSYAPVRPGQAPWIDADNRKRVLDRKDKPFRPEPEDH